MKIDRRRACVNFLSAQNIPPRQHPLVLEAMEPLLVTLDKGSYSLAERDEIDQIQIRNILSSATGKTVESLEILSIKEVRASFRQRQANAKKSFDAVAEMHRLLEYRGKDYAVKPLSQQIYDNAHVEPVAQRQRESVMSFLLAIGLSNGFSNNLRSHFGAELGEEIRTDIHACATGYLTSICREHTALADDFASVLDLMMTSYPMFQVLSSQGTWQILVA